MPKTEEFKIKMEIKKTRYYYLAKLAVFLSAGWWVLKNEDKPLFQLYMGGKFYETVYIRDAITHSGKIENVRLWSRALTSDEIQQGFNLKTEPNPRPDRTRRNVNKGAKKIDFDEGAAMELKIVVSAFLFAIALYQIISLWQ